MKRKNSRKQVARLMLAWSLSLTLAGPVITGPTASAATAEAMSTVTTAKTAASADTSTKAAADNSQRQVPPNGQPPMGPPPDGSTPPSPPPDGATPPGPPPGGQQGQPPQGGPGQQQTKSAAEFTATKIVDGTSATLTSGTFDATQTDVNAVLVRNGGQLTLKDATLTKSGDSSSADASNFSGQNAVFLAADSQAQLENLTLTSDADGANAVFATGSQAKVTAKNLKIHTKNNSSRGLDATYGGTIYAQQVDITTEGAHCAGLATDRGEGTVTVDGAKILTSGQGSPNVYSTGAITLKHATGKATGSEIAVVEGKNSITLEHDDLTGMKDHGVMLYQSFSGDAGIGEASFSAKDSTLRNMSDGPMFFVTNTTARASLQNVQLEQPGDTLVNVGASRWGKSGANGGNFTLTAENQVLSGAVKADSISSVTLNLGDKASYQGAFNTDNTAQSATITLAKTAHWDFTGDAYVTKLSDAASGYKNIASHGHNIYYDVAADTTRGGQTYQLPGGGKLMPQK
ncbi:MAG: hypothetical protein SOZ01_11440 [Selenomonadaceae bacterium]|nr:hypothetical protein [Selenomonadaceae bacterium]MDY3917312.1 hypothetical protein [Selenomonadaceae bacterium]